MTQMEARPRQDKEDPFSRAAALMLAGADAEAAAMWPSIGSLPFRGELMGEPCGPAPEVLVDPSCVVRGGYGCRSSRAVPFNPAR